MFPGNIFYKDCGHTPLPGERPKAWLDVDSLVKKIKMLSEISFYTKKAVRKIRAAIVGKDNCRLDDLPQTRRQQPISPIIQQGLKAGSRDPDKETAYISPIILRRPESR